MKLIIPLTLVSIAMVHAKPFGLANNLIRRGLERLANDLHNGFGLDQEFRPFAARNHEYDHGKEFGRRRYESGESGFGGEEHHDKGRREFHDIGHRNKKTSTVTKSESSESHNIGGSEYFDNGSSAGGAFNNYNNDDNEFGKEFDNDQDSSIIMI